MRRSHMVRVGWIALVAASALAAACAPEPPPPPPPLPDPIITCSSLDATIAYSPPASNAGVDITITTQPGSALSGCTDNTGSGITAGDVVDTSFLLPSFVCGAPPPGTVWGTGSGQIHWSDSSTSTFDAQIRAETSGFGSSVHFTFTGGRWSGARASVPYTITSSVGDCVNTPVTSATISASPFVLRPPVPPVLDGIARIAAGTDHTCALTGGGRVLCWGSNAYGQLGDGSTPSPAAYSDLPVEVVGITDAVEVTAGDFHSCALLSGGSVRCWGYGGRGELGDGTSTSSTTPVAVTGITDATAVAQGLAHTCALLPDGTARCWGYNFWGSLGDGTTTDRSTPVPVSGLMGAVSLWAGGDATCALDSSGHPRCWGLNGAGQLGDGTTTNRTTPVDVVGVTGVDELALGRNHTCARLGGDVSCWGANHQGQLGDGSTVASTSPVAVSGLSDATAIGAGWGHSCAVRADGGAVCWGDNQYGRLGDGTTTDRLVPDAVTGLGTAIQIVASNHSCARLAPGGVSCWGPNFSGQLGDGTTEVRTTPVAVRSSS